MLEDQYLNDEDIIKNPFQTIVRWAEENLHLTGFKVFPNVCLQPISLVMPPLNINGKKVRPNIHTLLLAPPSAGKSELCKLFGKITYGAFTFREITNARLLEDLNKKGGGMVSLIIEDVASTFGNPLLIKSLEGISGEERIISKLTMRSTMEKEINATVLACGLPQALGKWVFYGMMQRLTPMILFHTEEEKREIGKWTVKNMGNQQESNMLSEKNIKNYYTLIKSIQKDEIKDFKPVNGYVTNHLFNDRIYDSWVSMQDDIPFPSDSYLTRELHSAFRVLYASSMLNLFERKIEDDNGARSIIPNETDLKLAINMMESEMKTKFRIMHISQTFSTSSNIISAYNDIMNSEEQDQYTKYIASILVGDKREKIPYQQIRI